MRATCLAALAAAFSAAASSALPAQEATGDPAQGTGPLPVNVGPNPTPICADRPTKASVACTVPAGDGQLETDGVNWLTATVAGRRTDTILYTNPTIKYGLGTRTDVELNIAPYETVDTAGGAKLGGVGDLYLRVKQRLTDDSAKTQIAVIPFIKVPTARSGIGNRQVEGGVVAAANVPIPAGFTLTLGPEIDIAADADGPGHHLDAIGLVNLSHGIGKKVTVFGEVWTSQNFDPAGAIHQYSADVAAYSLTRTLQLDIGGDFGLNRATPDAQLYVGFSTRF